MFVRHWAPSSSVVRSDIEADAVVAGFWGGINGRERVLLIYLVAAPSNFAEEFNFRALFQ